MEYELKEVITTENFPLWENRTLEKEMNAAPKRYKEFKERHNDAIILFKVGDFYETYCEDAKTCAEICGITLRKINTANVDKMYRSCGFPKHCLNDYLAKLVSVGKRVALCEPIK